MSKPLVSFGLFLLVLATALGGHGSSLEAKDFTVSDSANDRMAKKLNMPVYLAVPASARADIGHSFDTSDTLIDFKHPDAKDGEGDVGLRLVVASRSGLTKRLAKSGLVQTGDILLSFRPEWGGAGAYPSVQMGISHTGVAYVKDGEVHNIDNPLNAEYLGSGMTGNLTGEHYGTLGYIHVIRPRGLTDAQKANIVAWATRLTKSAKKVYPSEISFNNDYNAPKYKSGKPLLFVKQFGQVALGQDPQGTLDLFCSEFAWSLLALRDCDPATTADGFKGGKVPACVKPIMQPMDATGDYERRKSKTSYAGLAEGPLMVISAMKLQPDKQKSLIQSVFVENPAGLSKLSEGHRKLAVEMQPKFAKLESYYLGVTGSMLARIKARVIGAEFNFAIPDNYSPTSYLINTLLPTDNVKRKMDYVATIVLQ